MRAGKLRHRLEIQERTTERDSFGDALETWKTVAVRWGSVEPLAGSKGWQASATTSDASVKITLRYFKGLTPRHRLKQGERVFSIEGAVNDDGTKREHLLMCVEEV